MALTASGRSGVLTLGYQVAARLGAWSLDERGIVSAELLDGHPLWLHKDGPFTLSLDIGTRQWTWPNVELRQREGALVAVTSGTPTRQ